MGNCRGCGREILWVVTESGALIPLDQSSHIYRLTGEGGIRGPRAKMVKDAFVNHFQVCTHVNDKLEVKNGKSVNE